jgi:hypothetical protein
LSTKVNATASRFKPPRTEPVKRKMRRATARVDPVLDTPVVDPERPSLEAALKKAR